MDMIAKLYDGRTRDDVAQLIDRHGMARVALAVMVALLRRRDPVLYEHRMSAHLRRDIGLDSGRSDPRWW